MMTSSVSLTPAADTAQHGLLAAQVLKVVAVPVCRLAIGHQTSAQLFDGCPFPAVQHVAQCEVLPRGDGPSPDERVGTQLRLGYQAPGLQNGSTPVADLVRWDHAPPLTAPEFWFWLCSACGEYPCRLALRHASEENSSPECVRVCHCSA